MKLFFCVFICAAGLLSFPTYLHADSDILIDTNDDEIVSIMGFGDSISYGLGDDTPVGAFVESVSLNNGTRGYLARIRDLGGLSTLNAAVPGEFLSISGISRLPNAVANSNADIVIFMEGANDSSIQLFSTAYGHVVQRAINVIRALGRIPVVMSNPIPCCNRADHAPFVIAYNSHIHDLAHVNSIHEVNLEHMWQTTCSSIASCQLYNKPDGLHPNTSGYDAIGQTVLATLFGIDIFAESGPQDLESALLLPEGSVIVQPDVMTPVE